MLSTIHKAESFLCFIIIIFKIKSIKINWKKERKIFCFEWYLKLLDKGDLTQDGKLSFQDALKALLDVAKLEELAADETDRADVNADGAKTAKIMVMSDDSNIEPLINAKEATISE